MDRAEQAASLLPHVKRLAEEHGPALKRAQTLLLDGALAGPAADRLQKTLANQHEDVRSAFYAAFDSVRHLASDAGPLRVREPYIAGAPRGGRQTPAVRSGSPEKLDQRLAQGIQHPVAFAKSAVNWEEWKQFQMNRGVIIDTRNADQTAINDMRRIIEQEGWGDRVIWYP